VELSRPFLKWQNSQEKMAWQWSYRSVFFSHWRRSDLRSGPIYRLAELPQLEPKIVTVGNMHLSAQFKLCQQPCRLSCVAFLVFKPRYDHPLLGNEPLCLSYLLLCPV
jgi:hypothetical protein